MTKKTTAILVFLLLFSALYYFVDFSMSSDYDYKVFLTIATFLFAIFTGFFVSRQGIRYSAIRDKISSFDGNLSAIYRGVGNISTDMQREVGEILKDHYKKILENKAWDYHFLHKSNTITEIHTLLHKELSEVSLPSFPSTIIMQVSASLKELQILRKGMVSLYKERVPLFQWMLLYLLSFILLVTLASLPSQGQVISSILKAAFSVAVLSVLFLLRYLDTLQLFESVIGEDSAKDVINIIDGTK